MLIELDYKDRRPIYEQVIEKLASMMMLGVLEENSQLPSVRAMAVALSINPNTIQRAYAELERQGYIYSVKGKGSFVADTSKLRQFRLKEARNRLTEAAREAARLGMVKDEIIKAVTEGAAGENCGENQEETGKALETAARDVNVTGGNEHD